MEQNGDRRLAVSRRRLLQGAVAGAAGMAMSGLAATNAAAAGDGSSDIATALSGVVARTIGAGHAGRLRLRVSPGEGETFTISGARDDISIVGTTRSAVLMGMGWYLKYVAHAAVNLGSPVPALSGPLPAPAAPITRVAHAANRFVFNDTNDAYTDPYMTWHEWERLLDLLALHGINQPYITVGAAAVYQQALAQFGYSLADLRAWIPQPAHQPWWLLQNMSSGTEPISQAVIDERAALGRRIADRARELGMSPVLPGFYGTVPADFADRHSGADVVTNGTWVGYQRPGWLNPDTQIFADVASAFYAASDRVMGAASMYKMDPLHEGGTAGDIDLPRAAAAIERALHAAHPGATWVMLGWQSNPNPKILAGIRDKARTLIVDGLSDRYPEWDRDSDWPGFPYAFGSIYNFGGHTTIGANTQVWLDRYYATLAKPGTGMAGIAIMPEGFFSNPAAFELLAELPWHPETFDRRAWLRDYALGRYGTADAAAAWKTLADTAYNLPNDGWSEPQDGLFAAQPSLTTTHAATWSPGFMRYDGTTFESCLGPLVAASASARRTDAYRYDLVDVTRQVIVNRSRLLLPQLRDAYQARDPDVFARLAADWLSLIELLDEVVGTSEDFLLGPRAAEASAASSSAGALQRDLLTLLTVWGSRAGFESGLGDYANRDWQGLVGGYYRDRWRAYLDAMTTALRSGRAPASIDWYAFGTSWVNGSHDMWTHPHGPGSILSLARRTIRRLSTDPSSVSLQLSLDGGLVTPSDGTQLTATVTNHNGLSSSIEGGTLAVSAPSEVSVTPTGPVSVGRIKAGGSVRVTWAVDLAGGTPDQVATSLTVRSDDGSHIASSTVLVGDRPASPWRTFTTADATMVQAGDGFAIDASGADMWGPTQQYGAIYRAGAFTADDTVTVQVKTLNSAGGRPWARAGLLVRNDQSTTDSGGVVDLAITPEHGCVLSWSPYGGGYANWISSFVNTDGIHDPIWLRLARRGSSFVGSFSSDGTTWTTVGTATPTEVAPAQDVGIFASAANSGATDRLTAVFGGWSLSPA